MDNLGELEKDSQIKYHNTDINEGKLYYSIGEVSKILKMNVSRVRLWSNEFEELEPKRNNKGNRFFTKDDLNILKRIKYLIEEKGMKIDGVKLELKKKESKRIDENMILELLEDVRNLLLDIKKRL